MGNFSKEPNGNPRTKKDNIWNENYTEWIFKKVVAYRRVTILKDRSLGFTRAKEQREKESLHDLTDNIKWYNTHVTGVMEVQKRDNGAEKDLKK